ncbi:MAG: isoprenylcysteine carboxylmethyltransferase family protein [Chloroflexi bacterium]|nr:isoprenylcysteine carboxylmethyltransferase family protein [Chloroflexota bacterium]
MSIMILLIALAIWGVVHSILASNFAKEMLGGASFYRLGYNIFAVISFAPILYLMKTLPDQSVYQIPAPWNILMLGGQIFAALMLLTAFLQTDSLSFVGLRQLFEVEKSGQLVTRGLYRVIRHPLYTFGLLFIWLTPSATQNSLTVYIGATIYTLVGAYFEERKLLREFGASYAEYKKKTPMLIPGLVFGKK